MGLGTVIINGHEVPAEFADLFFDGITYLTGSGNFSGFVGRFYGYNDN